MSYILDALRKAESQRAHDRLQVPDLLAQPAIAANASVPIPSRQGRPSWVWAAGVAILAALLAAGWAYWGATAPARPSAPLETPPSGAVSAAAGVPPSISGQAQPAPPPQPPTAAPVVTPAMPSMPPSAPTAPMPAPSPAVSPGLPPPNLVSPGGPPGGPRDAPAGAAASSERATLPTVVPTPGPRARSGAQPLPLMSQLPPTLRQEIPPLSLAGLVSSPHRASRLALVNGQVMREGERLSPELVLEEVRPGEVVFALRGQRFLVRP